VLTEPLSSNGYIRHNITGTPFKVMCFLENKIKCNSNTDSYLELEICAAGTAL
jgi:hypothetical protein